MGSALDTGNLGVSALCLSTIKGIAERLPTARITVFDYSASIRRHELNIGGLNIVIEMVGLTLSKRVYQSRNFYQVRAANKLGLSSVQPVLRKLKSMDAILDISGGDSFTDLYGDWRERSMTLPKLFVLELQKKLILTPQTFGPFRGLASAHRAKHILSNATLCYARDSKSYGIVKKMVGDRFSESQHKIGIDVAFNLPFMKPADGICTNFDKFSNKFGEVVGLNVSGLLTNTVGIDKETFGFKSGYADLVLNVIRYILRQSNTGIVLVPHVITGEGHYEDDITAGRSLLANLSEVERSKVFLMDDRLDAMQTKWLISRCDWFLGTRMHACIAALSSSRPTISIAYSDKTKGVFETAGFGEFVADPREGGCEQSVFDMIDRLRLNLAEFSQQLLIANERGISTWRSQFDDIVRVVTDNDK